MPRKSLYLKCDHIQHTNFDKEVSPKVIEGLSKDFDLPPLYESEMFKHAFIQHYSVVRNPLFSCRWRAYKQGIHERVYAPFQLPDVGELHFYNNTIRFYPPASIKDKDHRMKLKHGPGVDWVGQMPIPQEAQMKRGFVTTVKTDRLHKKAGTAKKDTTKEVKGKKAAKD